MLGPQTPPSRGGRSISSKNGSPPIMARQTSRLSTVTVELDEETGKFHIEIDKATRVILVSVVIGILSFSLLGVSIAYLDTAPVTPDVSYWYLFISCVGPFLAIFMAGSAYRGNCNFLLASTVSSGVFVAQLALLLILSVSYDGTTINDNARSVYSDMSESEKNEYGSVQALVKEARSNIETQALVGTLLATFLFGSAFLTYALRRQEIVSEHIAAEEAKRREVMAGRMEVRRNTALMMSQNGNSSKGGGGFMSPLIPTRRVSTASSSGAGSKKPRHKKHHRQPSYSQSPSMHQRRVSIMSTASIVEEKEEKNNSEVDVNFRTSSLQTGFSGESGRNRQLSMNMMKKEGFHRASIISTTTGSPLSVPRKLSVMSAADVDGTRSHRKKKHGKHHKKRKESVREASNNKDTLSPLPSVDRAQTTPEMGRPHSNPSSVGSDDLNDRMLSGVGGPSSAVNSPRSPLSPAMVPSPASNHKGSVGFRSRVAAPHPAMDAPQVEDDL